jgi:hypothetical protein
VYSRQPAEESERRQCLDVVCCASRSHPVDIDGTANAQTVTFGFQGVAYSIDLSPKHLEKLATALSPFIDHASMKSGRKVAIRKPAATRKQANTLGRSYDLVQLREWAVKNKVKVPSRGRIPGAVVEQYQAAGGR